MEPLKLNKLAMMWMWMCPSAESEKEHVKLIRKICGILVFFIFLFATITCFYGSLNLYSNGLEESLFTFSCTLLVLEKCYDMTIGYLWQHQIHSVYTKLPAIYDACKISF